MGTRRLLLPVGALLFVVEIGASAQGDALKCLQKPIAWMVGQQTRIVIETPADCGKLEVTSPREVELFDRWPWKQGDTQQKFHFRAKAPLAEGKLRFMAERYSLDVPIQVLTWAQATEPRQFEEWKLPRLFPLEGTDEHKKGPTFLSREELATIRKSGLPNSEEVARSLPADEKLFNGMVESTLPRAPFVQSVEPKGCPVCGRKIFEGRSPFYPWVVDPEKHPWKVGCPECGRWFPSNDFAAGDMHSGEFPDDGWGYFKLGEKIPYAFIAYYTQWSYHGKYPQQVESLCDLYARSGNRKIGHSAAVGFLRIAEQYLNLAVNINQRKGYMRNAVWTGGIIPQTKVTLYNTWLYIEHNWEVPYVSNLSRAFDKLWDFFEQEDPELLSFMQQHGHPEIKTMEDIRNFIETGYFRTVAQACLDKGLIGNLPQGQRATVETALFLNTPRSFELVDWVFNGPGLMRYFLTNDYFIDGSAFESQGYNAGHVYNLEEFAQVMEKVRKLNPDRYTAGKFPALTADPKYKQLFDFCLNFNLIGRTHAQTGDCGDVAGTDPLPQFETTDVAPNWFVGPYALTKEPRFALALYDPQTKAPIPAVTDPELRASVEKAVAERGADIEQVSNVCDGYGHAILRSGRGEDRRALWIRYGVARGHYHDDMLTIGWEAKQRKLLPELGYPHSWNWRVPWEGNWATHYAARVLGGPPSQYPEDPWRRTRRGHCKLFADGPWARAATAYSLGHQDVPPPEVYRLLPDQLMERTVALIDLNEQDSYVVDVFHLGGGSDNYWSFHGPRSEGEASLEGLKCEKQNGGTLAGADVAYGKGEEWTKNNPELSAFPFLYDVSRGKATKAWSLDWPLQKHPDIHLRMTALPASETEVALAKGKPPGGGQPYELQWVLLHTSGNKPHYSQFVAVHEVYEGQRLVDGAQRLQVTTDNPGDLPPVALQVSATERIDTIISSREPKRCQAAGLTSDGVFAVWSEKAGQLDRAYLVGGRTLKKGQAGLEAAAGEWRGAITRVDYKNRTVTVQPAAPYPAALVGRYVRFANEFSDCTHLIVRARNAGDTTELALELDPRIGEGPVDRADMNYIVSGIPMHLSELRYCHGKTLTNEDGSAAYRLAGVTGQSVIYVDTTKHANVPKEKLEQQFTDRDGDGIKRFVIYDYGVGDTTCVTYSISLQKTGAQRWLLETPVQVSLQLPGLRVAASTPETSTAGALAVRLLRPGRLEIGVKER